MQSQIYILITGYVLKSRYIYYDVNNAKHLEGVVAFIEHLSLQSPLVSVYKIWCCSKIYFTHCFCWVWHTLFTDKNKVKEKCWGWMTIANNAETQVFYFIFIAACIWVYGCQPFTQGINWKRAMNLNALFAWLTAQ